MLFSKFLTSLFLVCLLWGFSNQSIAQLTPLYPSLKVINQVSIYPSYTDSTVQVFLFYSPDCPICKAFVPYIRQIKQQFERQGVQFALILPQSLRYKLSEIRKHEVLDSIAMNTYLDKKNKMTQALGAIITPQVFVFVGPQQVYSGLINDLYYAVGQVNHQKLKHYLHNNLHKVLSRQNYKIQNTNPVGCLISSW